MAMGVINLLDDDMDGDGFLDRYEIAPGSDPLNRDSVSGDARGASLGYQPARA